jgi:hypothetical protein
MTVSIRVSSNPVASVTSNETTVGHSSYVYESPNTVSIRVSSTPLASTTVVNEFLQQQDPRQQSGRLIVALTCSASYSSSCHGLLHEYLRKIMNDASLLCLSASLCTVIMNDFFLLVGAVSIHSIEHASSMCIVA